jgi:hypothetical protein
MLNMKRLHKNRSVAPFFHSVIQQQYLGLIGYLLPYSRFELPKPVLPRALKICEDANVSGNFLSDSDGKGFRNTVVIFVPMKVMAISAFEILIGDFDFKTGDHHPNAPIMAPQDTAPAFLRILLCAAIPKAFSGFMSMLRQVWFLFGKPLRIQKPAEIFLILVIVLKPNAVYDP